ncbi:MAG: response regulator [Elusimicrobia bacterium]|nr:response regulator [Elusimicrobiota bacterium]
MKKKRILIVDDEKGILDFLSKAIIKGNCGIVETTSSVTDAIWKFAESPYGSPYNILITDMKMPDKSGIFLIRHVKIFFPNCKIIAMSSDNSSLEEARKFGASACLLKPFNISDVVEQLKDEIDDNIARTEETK